MHTQQLQETRGNVCKLLEKAIKHLSEREQEGTANEVWQLKEEAASAERETKRWALCGVVVVVFNLVCMTYLFVWFSNSLLRYFSPLNAAS